MKKKSKSKIYPLKEAIHPEKNVIQSVNDLIKVLTTKKIAVDQIRLKELLNNPFLEMYLLEVEGKIVGMGSLYYVETLVKKAAWIEDVVVHSEQQGKGFGKKIMKHIISEARKKGVKHVDLTSRHRRVGAHKFYQKLNFEKRKTNVYRLKMKK